jgi:hypothetical protein
MATHTITISASTTNPYPLTISDDENHSASTATGDAVLTTGIDAGDEVIWTPSGDISSINNIIDKSTPVNLFSSGPAPKNDGTGSWSGIVGNSASNTEEAYSIQYNVNGAANNPYTQDPKLKMN